LRAKQKVMANRETEFFQPPERAVGKAKVRLVPECYILPRRSIPKTIALYSSLVMAGVGVGMLVEVWIKEQVKNDTAILFRKKDEAVSEDK
jgi:hypothetical protein